jgi:hypothetical protein
MRLYMLTAMEKRPRRYYWDERLQFLYLVTAPFLENRYIGSFPRSCLGSDFLGCWHGSTVMPWMQPA